MLFRQSAFAKINLFLHVTGKRPDGYHLLQSLAVFADIGDTIALRSANGDSDTLTIDGPFGHRLRNDDPDNLILKAIRAWRTNFPQCSEKFEIVLTKNLPVAGGIGGGSSDAAACLRALADYYAQKDEMRVDTETLRRIGLSLGADLPVCIEQKSALMEGIGEKLRPFETPKLGILLVNPLIGVSTPSIFKEYSALNQGMHTPLLDEDALAGSQKNSYEFLKLLQATHNDLETPACNLTPEITEILRSLNALPDILLARMSGSGGTCFGLFENEESAERAAKSLDLNPNYWVAAGSLK